MGGGCAAVSGQELTVRRNVQDNGTMPANGKKKRASVVFEQPDGPGAAAAKKAKKLTPGEKAQAAADEYMDRTNEAMRAKPELVLLLKRHFVDAHGVGPEYDDKSSAVRRAFDRRVKKMFDRLKSRDFDLARATSPKLRFSAVFSVAQRVPGTKAGSPCEFNGLEGPKNASPVVIREKRFLRLVPGGEPYFAGPRSEAAPQRRVPLPGPVLLALAR